MRLLSLTLLTAGAAWGSPPSSLPTGYRPLPTQGLCPALAEDYELCSDDLMSGNCAGFVTAAGHLGEIYRDELRAHPGWVDGLRTAIWWGCGSARLVELRGLLERIDSPPARAVLAQEPYASLGEAHPTAPVAPPPAERDCVAPATAAERDACAAQNLERTKSRHEQFLSRCREQVAPALRQELIDGEASWEKLLPLECSGAASTRDECLADAYANRSASLASMHPECAASRR